MSASTQEFCVRWNSHLGSIGAAFPQLLAGQRFVDVTLACEGHQVHCHRLVLAACSTYFEAILAENPCKHPVIILPSEIKLWEIQALVDFMYKGEVNVTQAGLGQLLRCAEQLRIRGLYGSEAAINYNQLQQMRHDALAQETATTATTATAAAAATTTTAAAAATGTAAANLKQEATVLLPAKQESHQQQQQKQQQLHLENTEIEDTITNSTATTTSTTAKQQQQQQQLLLQQQQQLQQKEQRQRQQTNGNNTLQLQLLQQQQQHLIQANAGGSSAAASNNSNAPTEDDSADDANSNWISYNEPFDDFLLANDNKLNVQLFQQQQQQQHQQQQQQQQLQQHQQQQQQQLQMQMQHHLDSTIEDDHNYVAAHDEDNDSSGFVAANIVGSTSGALGVLSLSMDADLDTSANTSGSSSSLMHSSIDGYTSYKRVRRSEASLAQAAKCVSKGETFQTVSNMFNIPVSTIRFYMARKGILPKRKRGRGASHAGSTITTTTSSSSASASSAGAAAAAAASSNSNAAAANVAAAASPRFEVATASGVPFHLLSDAAAFKLSEQQQQAHII
ncbi:protein jim lovell [Drosophila grimshawi]|uniref:protein jim lovell n=1 Tax=Drosophila grimshawi TaxID=7222 RepID=UPI001C9334E0|nr:protein jim lovell [Drosophila grimshawi]